MKYVRSLALAAALATPLLFVSPASASSAGQFCKKADAGSVTTADNGDMIRCTYDADSERHHWKKVSSSTDSSGTEREDDSLAETGGSSVTPYIAAGGAVLLLGGGALALKRRRTS